jgi:hypothetical protein
MSAAWARVMSALVSTGVADDEDPDVVGGVRVECCTSGSEDAAVGFEQVGAFHALAAGSGADQQRHVGAVECAVGGIGDLDAVQEWEGAAVEFHGGAFGGPDSLGISSSCSRTGVSGPRSCPEAMRKSRA